MNNISGFGLHCSNIFGSISIVESAFLRSKGKKLIRTMEWTDFGVPLNEPIIKISNRYIIIEKRIAKNGGGLIFWSRPEMKHTSIICTGTSSVHKLQHYISLKACL